MTTHSGSRARTSSRIDRPMATPGSTNTIARWSFWARGVAENATTNESR